MRFNNETGYKGSKNFNNNISMKPIIVKHGMNKYLGEVFSRSQPFVRKALRGKTDHPDAIKIRDLANKKLNEFEENNNQKTT